jgi:hypothetical protein
MASGPDVYIYTHNRLFSLAGSKREKRKENWAESTTVTYHIEAIYI